MKTEHLVPLGPNVTRDGRKVRVICNDLVGASRPVIAAVEIRNTPNSEVTSYHFANGTVHLDGTPSPSDLVGHLPPKPREVWIAGLSSTLITWEMDNPKDGKHVLFREVLPGEDDELKELRQWKADVTSLLNGHPCGSDILDAIP